ncbi:MAG: diacylglycerol kinase family protein [Planctomycetota bacterium]
MCALPASEPPPPLLRKFVRGFYFAFAGVGHVWREQLNIKVHFGATILVIALGLFLSVDRRDWIALVICIGMVWTAEALNTALELIADVASPEFHPLVGKAKDIGAGAVLLSAITAAVVALLVYVPHLAAYLGYATP